MAEISSMTYASLSREIARQPQHQPCWCCPFTGRLCLRSCLQSPMLSREQGRCHNKSFHLWLILFIMRKMCGVVFFKLQHAAKKACSDPVRNAHAKCMRQQEALYKGWLLPKFQSYCNHLRWTMPRLWRRYQACLTLPVHRICMIFILMNPHLLSPLIRRPQYLVSAD
jgi:hypothetical protein